MKDNFLHIIIVSSHYYAPYLATLLRSVIDNKGKDDNLDINIVSEDMSPIIQTTIK